MRHWPSTAAEAKVSPKYLPMVWPLLEEPEDKAKQEVGPIAKLQAMWRALPAPNADKDPKSTRCTQQCLEMRDFVVQDPQPYGHAVLRAGGERFAAGSQPLLNWKLYAVRRAPPRVRPEGLRNDTRHRPAGADDSAISRAASGSRRRAGPPLQPKPARATPI